MSPPSLPHVLRPKLALFTPTSHAEIKFVRALGGPDDQEAYVWEFEANGRAYAFKIVSSPSYLIQSPGHPEDRRNIQSPMSNFS